MSQFDITFSAGKRISGEYRAGKSMVIFSHGFDVRGDSNGLFHDIYDSLPNDVGYITFDYHYYDGPIETLRPLSEQASVLHHVTSWCKSQLKPISLHLIAHSMGCTVASYAADLSFDKIIYLAPPLKTSGGLRKFFTSHQGAIKTAYGYDVKRRSGKTTRVGEKFFSEFESANPEAFIKAYSSHHPITIIYAKNDRFIPEQEYFKLRNIKGIHLESVEADHNFTGSSREYLTKHIIKILENNVI